MEVRLVLVRALVDQRRKKCLLNIWRSLREELSRSLRTAGRVLSTARRCCQLVVRLQLLGALPEKLLTYVEVLTVKNLRLKLRTVRLHRIF